MSTAHSPVLFRELDRDARKTIVRFVVSFLLADLRPTLKDAEFVAAFARTLGLSRDDEGTALSWLTSPPEVEDLDPTALPEWLVPLVHAGVGLALATRPSPRPRARELLALMGELTLPRAA